MRNCLILGSGRSGTSMVAGTLARAGYFMGERLHAPRPSNPKGFYEDVEVNAINEAILSPVTPWLPPRFRPGRLYCWLRRTFFPGRPGEGERWLARVLLNARLISTPEIEARIQALVKRVPFCLKDPRFCYTLPAWQPWLGDTRFVCVFREPTASARSMLREIQTTPKLAGLKLTYADCLDIWLLMYSHILENHCQQGEWVFLHYEQMLDGSGLERLAAFLDVTPDCTFPDPALRRTRPAEKMPETVRPVYKQLCLRAGFRPINSGGTDDLYGC